jgi:hypothetical protein
MSLIFVVTVAINLQNAATDRHNPWLGYFLAIATKY